MLRDNVVREIILYKKEIYKMTATELVESKSGFPGNKLIVPKNSIKS